MIPGPRRRPVYGMAYGTMSGVQSSPRIMRGAPVVRPAMFDIPLATRRRATAILHEQGRLTVLNGKRNGTGTLVVPAPMSGLESQGLARTLGSLGGLESQGLARTLGSIGGNSIGGNSLGSDAVDSAEIEMAEECMRPGEILLAPGVCGPDPRNRVNPYAAQPGTYAIPMSTTTTKASAPFAGAAKSSIEPRTLIIGGIALAGLLYFLGRK